MCILWVELLVLAWSKERRQKKQELQSHSFPNENHNHTKLKKMTTWIFDHRGLKCKSRNSRSTWSNKQVWPWRTKWSRAKANRILPKEQTAHSKHSLPTTQEMTPHMDITRWLILKSDGLSTLQQKMEKLYTVSKTKTGSWLWLISLLQNSSLNWRKYGKTKTVQVWLKSNHLWLQWRWQIDSRD